MPWDKNAKLNFKFRPCILNLKFELIIIIMDGLVIKYVSRRCKNVKCIDRILEKQKKAEEAEAHHNVNQRIKNIEHFDNFLRNLSSFSDFVCSI